MCHLAGGAAPVLAGALADRLLLARSSASTNGRVDVSPRFVTLLQPLLVGWATLSARGFLPGDNYMTVVQQYTSDTTHLSMTADNQSVYGESLLRMTGFPALPGPLKGVTQVHSTASSMNCFSQHHPV